MPLLPECVRRIETQNGTKLVFPWREIPSPLRVQIRIYYALGLGGLLIAFLLASVAVSQPGDELTAKEFGGAVIVAILGLAALGYAVSLSWTRSIIEFSRHRLKLTEQVGLSRRCRERVWANVASIRTHNLIHTPGESAEPPTAGTLEIAGRGAQPLWVAHDYPRDWLLTIGPELAAAGGVEHEEVPLGSPTVRMRAFLASEVEDLDTIDLPDKPLRSRALVERRPVGLTIVVPPTASEWVAMAAWAGLGLGIVAMITLIAMLFPMQAPPQYLSLTLFASVGAVIMSLGYLAAHRTTVIVIDDRMVFAVTKPSLGFTQRHAVFRGEVRAVRSEYDAQEGKQAFGHSLCLELPGKKRRLLVWRTHDEVRWLATVIRAELGVPAVTVRMLTS